ncbi:NYN domain-containing protein [bacterium]|nr:NYN domain-containing protein [bacterium]
MKKTNDQIFGGRTCVFIDASNIWSVQKSKKYSLDYAKLTKALGEIFHTESLQIYYYTAFPGEGTRVVSQDGKHKFFTFLEKGLKFIVRKKPLKRISVLIDGHTVIQEKGNMDVEMTIDALHTKDKYDTAVFLTGDSDFLSLITYLRNSGKKVYVFSSKNSVSQELRTGSNGYFDLLKLTQDIWGNELRHRRKV